MVRVHPNLHRSAALVSNVQPRGAVWVGNLLPIFNIHGTCQRCIDIHKSQYALSQQEMLCTVTVCRAETCTAQCIACVTKHHRLKLYKQAIRPRLLWAGQGRAGQEGLCMMMHM